MMMHLAISILGIVALLVLSGAFAGAQTALSAVSKARMQRLASEGSRRARHSIRLLADRDRVGRALVFGTVSVNVLASALATFVALQLFPESGVLIAAVVTTVIIFAFAEVLPKALAIAHTERFALSVAGLIRVAVAVLGPLAAAAQWPAWRVLNALGTKAAAVLPLPTPHEEIRGAIELQHHEGGVEREHRDMLGGILDLTHLKLADVMVHRKNMEVLDGGASPETVVERVLASEHTRFPIWRDDPENIVGVLHLKALVRTLMERKGSLKNLDIMSLASEPWYVPDATTLEEQLAAFRERREHFALVVDEYGALQGLVTLEDILEEVFGKIAEGRAQPASEHIRQQVDGSYVINGQMPVRELNRQLHWALPIDGATTIAGLVINEARIIPEVGQVFSFYGFKFEILRRQRNQITAVRIVPPQPAPEELADDTG